MRRFSLAALTTLCLAASPLFLACAPSHAPEEVESSEGAIVDVQHTPIERQSIGNCWIYAEATWVESIHLAATGNSLDVSQSYWTYWHWYGQIVGGFTSEIQTGGFQATAHNLARTRGVVKEADFVPSDGASETSSAQASALAMLNQELSTGRLKDQASRTNRTLVRQIMDEAWGLSPTVSAWMTSAFGADGAKTIGGGASLNGTPILAPSTLAVRYTERVGTSSLLRDTNLSQAINAWRTVSYPSSATSRRSTLKRVQRALHDRQPVVITWNVDFNALESRPEDPRRGTFNLETLARIGVPGGQGGHMTVLEDYEVETAEFGTLKAGVTLDPVADAAKLQAALLDSSNVTLLRMKNSWGTARPDRGNVPGMPGYHDMAIDYANGPIAWCPDREAGEECLGTTQPLRSFLLPPGY